MRTNWKCIECGKQDVMLSPSEMFRACLNCAEVYTPSGELRKLTDDEISPNIAKARRWLKEEIKRKKHETN